MTGVVAAAAGAAAASLKPLSVVCSPDAVTGVWEPELNVGITDVCAAVVDGGKAPYTFVWSHVSGDSFAIIGGDTSIASFSFSGGGHLSGVFRVTVTDSLSQTATDTVSVTAN